MIKKLLFFIFIVVNSYLVSFSSDKINLNLSEIEENSKYSGFSIDADGEYSGKLGVNYETESGLSNKTSDSENTGKISRKDILFCVGMSYSLEGNIVSSSIENEEIVSCYNNMLNAVFKGETKASVFLDTGEVVFCNITVIDPIVNTDTIKASSEDFQVKVFGDLKGSKVNYSIISDDENATIDDEGNVHVPYGSGCLIKVEVAGKVFTKEINGVDYKSKLWNDMQYGIEQCLGTPYVLGGFSPGVALDCSGYVSYIYNTVGLMSGRTSAQGLYNMAKKTEEPEPGDMCFFAGTYNCPDYITHVGLYAGGNMMYHSGKPNQLVEISGYYAQHFVGFGTLIY